MRKYASAVMFCLFAAAGLGAGSAQDQIVVPTDDGMTGSSAPFACGTRFQQVWNASLFPGKMRIDAIVFYNNVRHSAEGYIEPARYQFSLSQTDVSAESITADFGSNLGQKTRQVIDWTVTGFTGGGFSGGTTGSLTLPLSRPFIYDPAKGNLLLDIQKDQSACEGDGPIYIDASSAADGVALVNDSFGVLERYGMTVGFVGKFTP